ncbi:MAG: hypothetical protein AAFX53_18320 [Bacteroidota bacterium]
MEYKDLVQYVYYELAISFWLTGDYVKSMEFFQILQDSERVPVNYPNASNTYLESE